MSDYLPSVTLPPLSVQPPLVSRERFSEMTGIPLGVIVGWCNKGLVPCMSIGKYSLINISLLQKQCLAKEFA